MRAVLVAVGSRGDAVPFVALARRLTARGHDVVLVTHAVYAPHPGEAPDLVVVPVDSDPATVLSGPAATALRRWDVRGLNRARGEFADFVASVAEPVARVVDGADVVVASTFATAAVSVARRAGVPVVRVHLWPERADLDGPMPLAPYSWALPPALRRGARRGLRAVEPLLAGFDGWWERGRLRIVSEYDADFTTNDLGSLHAYSSALAADADVDPVLGAGRAATGRRHRARATVTGWWDEPAASSVSAPTSALLATPGPWVYVGFGSMHQARPADVLRAVGDACARLDVQAVVHLPGLPAGTTAGAARVVPPEPHAALLPHVVAAVHHGGSGTTSAVVRAGVPSVVVPHIADQFYWAHRLHTVGAAARPLPRTLLTAGRLRRRLADALDPARAACARTLAARVCAEDGAAAAVRYLETVVPARAGRAPQPAEPTRPRTG